MRTGIVLLGLHFIIASGQAAEPSKAKLAELVKLYRAYDLPQPPKNAKLYRFTDVRGEKPEQRRVWLQLVFRPEAEDGPNMTLRGLDTSQFRTHNSATYKEVSPPDAKAVEGVTDDTEDLFLLALQCDLLGWHELAVAAFDAWHSRQLKSTNPVGDLRHRAWLYWVNQIHEPNSDWVKVARRLQGMHNEKPNATDADTPDILRRLKLSLVPSKAKPGSVDALIDDLIDASAIFGDGFSSEQDPRLDVIVKLGFDAIPALIEHLDDDRLTRSRSVEYVARGLGLPIKSCAVRHLAQHILYHYMSDETSRQALNHGKDLSTEAAAEWWAAAKKEGEEKYLLRKVVPDDSTPIWPNTQLIRAIEVKYPQRLPNMFAALVKSKQYHTTFSPFVEALERSPLPAATKKRVLLDTFERDDWYWKADILIGLYPLDAIEFHKRLIASLGDLPEEDDNRNPVFDGYACFAYAACLTDDEKTWQAVGKYMRRVNADVRMRWIGSLTWWGDEKSRSRVRRIACVAAFLDDEPVRNYAAEHLGRMLNLSIEPDPEWTADEWAKFRERVAKASKAAK